MIETVAIGVNLQMLLEFEPSLQRLLKFLTQAIDDPSSNQFRDPPTYTHQPSMQQKVPFSLIRCSSSKVAFCRCVEWGWHIYNIVESESDPLTRRAVDLFEKEPLKGNSEVHLHTPTKFGEDRSKDLGGDREQTDRQTNRQTDKRCSIYSMISVCKVGNKIVRTCRSGQFETNEDQWWNILTIVVLK